jgi:hypothetical protein
MFYKFQNRIEFFYRFFTPSVQNDCEKWEVSRLRADYTKCPQTLKVLELKSIFLYANSIFTS